MVGVRQAAGSARRGEGVGKGLPLRSGGEAAPLELSQKGGPVVEQVIPLLQQRASTRLHHRAIVRRLRLAQRAVPGLLFGDGRPVLLVRLAPVSGLEGGLIVAQPRLDLATLAAYLRQVGGNRRAPPRALRLGRRSDDLSRHTVQAGLGAHLHQRLGSRHSRCCRWRSAHTGQRRVRSGRLRSVRRRRRRRLRSGRRRSVSNGQRIDFVAISMLRHESFHPTPVANMVARAASVARRNGVGHRNERDEREAGGLPCFVSCGLVPADVCGRTGG